MVDLVAELADEITNLIIKFNKQFDKLRFKIYRKLTVNSEKLLLFLREGIAALLRDYDISLEPSEISETDEVQAEEADMVTCPRCRFRVKKSKFCNKCGAPLADINIRRMENRITKISALIKDYEIFLNLARNVFTEAELKISDNIELILKQILVKQTKQHDHLIDVMTAKKAPRVVPKPIVEDRVAPVTPPTPTTQPIQTFESFEEVIQVIEEEKITPTIKPRIEMAEPAIAVDIKSKPTFYSRFERNLVHYWFFYLSILFLTTGVIITVVFVVKEITSVTQQLIIIYSIGFTILVIGEVIAVLSRRRQKKAQIREEADKEGKEETDLLKESEGRFPLPTFGTVILFIGLLVIYTAGIIGFGSTIPRSVFVYVSFGVAILAIVLGVLNDSEMITLTGFIPALAIIVVDITWEGAPALSEAEIFVTLTIPIILAAITAIFFKKWWGLIVMVFALPVIICLPMVSTKMGLEFIPLVLIPLMMLLVTRYDKNNIPFTHKKILVVMSQILPIVGLTIISFPAINFSDTEPLWARIYPVEIIIATLIVLGISFFYQFIQEKYLEIKSKVCIFYHVGQGLVGAISIIMVIINRDSFNGFIYSIIYFSFFFVVGVLGILKVFKQHLTLVGTIVSFALAEIHVIFMFSLINISPELKLGIQFATALIFTLLAIMTTIFSKGLNVSKYLFSSWIIISAVNNIIFIFIQKANYWFIFGSLALFLVLPMLSFEPNKGIPNYIGQIAVGILSLMMILSNLGNPNNYIFSIIFFVTFFILGIVSTIFKNYFTLMGTIISFAIAEVHAVLILSLFDMSNTFKLIIYFVVGISFIILAITAIALTKKLEVTKQIFTTWIIFAVINLVILSFIQKLTIWYVIGAILLFLILPALNIKPNVDIPYYIGLGSIGVLTSVLAGLNHSHSINYVFIIICFAVFLIIGILGLIKKLENNYTLPGTLVSFAFAEVLAVLGMIFLDTSTNAQFSIYYIIAISFLVLALFAIILSKIFEVSKYLYIGWIGASLVNSLLLLLMGRVTLWYAFALVLLFFAVTAVELKPNTGISNIVGKCSVGVLSIVMITTSLTDINNYVFNVVFYSLFFIIGILGIIKALQKNFSLPSTLISFGFAEVLVILSMILQDTTTTGQISIYFIMAISFLVISLLSIFLVKFLKVSKYLYFGFIGASLVNSLLLLLMNKVDNWFAFALVLLFFAVSAVELEPNKGIGNIVAKCSVGVLTIIMITTNLADINNYIYNVVFYGLFLIIGFLGLIKVLQKNFSLPSILISFGFAEVLVILSMILQSTSTVGQTSIYFIMAISFLVISLLAIFLVKFLEVSEYIYLGFIGASLVNSLLLLFMNKVNSWLTFAMLVLFFVVTAIELEPNTGRNQIIGKSAIGVLSIIMVAVNFANPNNFIYNGVFFGLFFIIGVVGLLNILKKYFNQYGTFISIALAEVHAILLLVLMNPTNSLQITFYFIIAISFNFIAMISIVFMNVFIRSDVLLFGWIIISSTNAIIMGLSSKISPWFSFIAILLLLVLVALNNLPLFGQRIDYWRIISLVTAIIALTVIAIFVFTGYLEFFKHDILVIFLLYALVNIPIFINWKKEEVAVLG